MPSPHRSGSRDGAMREEQSRSVACSRRHRSGKPARSWRLLATGGHHQGTRKVDMGVTTTLRPVEHSGKDKRVPEPCIFVVFGASGDLTKRKLLPALFHLRQAGLLSEEFAVVGV